MKLPTGRRYYFENGEWWFQNYDGKQARCTVCWCQHCCEEFIAARPGSPKRKYCTPRCAYDAGSARAAESRRLGLTGRKMQHNGYVQIRVDGHPSVAHTKNKYIPEHRLVLFSAAGEGMVCVCRPGRLDLE
jgi:hypothetical protein